MPTTQSYNLSRLAATGNPDPGSVGDTDRLTDSWKDAGTRVHVLVAPAGAGKTTLVRHWLAELEKDGFPGADQVLAWTFHGQGSGPAAASCDAFLDHALAGFGDAAPSSGSPWDRGLRLARLAQARRTLLVLDGVDTQQERDGKGRWLFLYPALTALVKALSRHNPGLCVITGRNGVAEVHGEEGVTHDEKPKGLDPKHSAPLLKTLKKKRSAPARHVLRALALFQGPARRGAVEAVCAGPAFGGLDEKAVGKAVAELREAGLLSHENPGAGDASESLDLPRVVRDGVKLEEAARKEGHKRLFEFYQECQPHHPVTLGDTLPICAAVAHGCEAGEVKAAYELYRHRIVRKPDYFGTFRLGAFAAEDAALRAFFEPPPWNQLRPGLKAREDRATLLLAAGVNLRSLGRPADALGLFQKALAEAKGTEDFRRRAADAESGRSEVLLAQGKIEEAIGAAETSVEHADASKDGLQRTAKRAYLADALHQAGRLQASQQAFREAEALQAEWQPAFPLLYSLRGYQYCDLLLREPEVNLLGAGPRPTAGERRRLQGLLRTLSGRLEMLRSWRQPMDTALDRGLEHLLQGRVWLALFRAEADEDPDLLREARRDLDEGIRLLREYGALHRLPYGLLARAAFHRANRDFEGADADLREAQDLADLSGLRLVEADAHLEEARLALAREDERAAKARLKDAKRLVTKHRYRRRDREVTDLEAALA